MFLMVMDENDGTHDEAALSHMAIIAVTCHYGLEREVSNGKERTEKGRKRQRVRGCIRAIRNAGLRCQVHSCFAVSISPGGR